jgi:branched-chain amino acid transport system ATP-binding protein
MSLLALTDLRVRYGQVTGIDRLSLEIAEGEMLALVGSNGAGKSSTLRAIMGLVPTAGGDIRWRGESLKGRRRSDLARMGIGYSPEGRRVFPQLSVFENLKVGAFSQPSATLQGRLEQIYGYFPRLQERSSQRASSLSGGEQQMLAIGRALMSFPKLFLLDEPSLGLAPIIVERIGEILVEIQREEGLAVILAEQNANWAMRIASRALILELGRKVVDGPSADLMRDPKVQSAYLGLS